MAGRPRLPPDPPPLSRLPIKTKSPTVARLALRADGQHEHRVNFFGVMIKSKVPLPASADDKFSLPTRNRSTDQRIVNEDVQRVHDLTNSLCRGTSACHQEMIEDTFEIVLQCGRKLNARHGYWPSLRAFGRPVGWPLARSSK